MGDFITATQGLLENVSLAQSASTDWDTVKKYTVRTGVGFAFWLQFVGAGSISIHLRISPIYPERGGAIVNPNDFVYQINDVFAGKSAPVVSGTAKLCHWAAAPTEINYPYATIWAQAVEQGVGTVSGLWLFTTYNGE